MKVKDILREARPVERFLNFGGESLSEPELLAIILKTGLPGENVVELSQRIISKFGIQGISNASIEELMEIKGIGRMKAVQILAIFELGKRAIVSKKSPSKIISAKSVFDLFGEKFRGKEKEYFYVVLLDTKNKIIRSEEISVGILDASIVHPREIFKSAIRASASRIILVHNHPSGDPTPSEEDLSITRKLIDVGELVGIEVLDHVIIGRDKYYSYIEG